MVTFIGQILGCLFVAAAIGLAMGWFLRSFTTSEKRQQLSEIAARLRGREHEMDSLHHELKVRTSAVQILESKMMAAEAALKDLQGETAAKSDQIDALQTRLTDQTASTNSLGRETETLRQALAEAEQTLEERAKGYADMQAELETAQDFMVRRDQEIATLKTWVDQLEVKEAEIIRLRGQVKEMDLLQQQLAAAETGRLEVEQQMRKTRDERDALEARLQLQLNESMAERRNLEVRAREEASQHVAALQEQEALTRALHERLAELESLRQDLTAKQAELAQAEERRMMEISEREEEIAALRRRLVEYRVAQGLMGKAAARQPEAEPADTAPPSKPSNGSGHPKDDLKKIHGIGPVIERVLNRMGMYTFLQIAQMDQTDIVRVADKLNTFPDRIVRDNWIEGAKQQHYLKYGEKL
ncbi:MAG TPA: hypothetical protein VFG71_14720 [Nitrospiraceae bacterium]|nr:hypothetical protein [Nitrospiraceae bacterium]